MRLRSALLVLGIGLGLSGIWMLIPGLLEPKTAGLPFDRNGAESAAAGSPEAENRVGPLLEMSYFTAPSAPDLALSRIQRAVTSSALANTDLQTFVSGDLREILGRGPQFQQAIIAAYRGALPQNQPIFESLVADVDPAVAQSLRSGQQK